jgi:hypothetical protein
MSITLKWYYAIPVFRNATHVEMILVVKLRVVSPSTGNV